MRPWDWVWDWVRGKPFQELTEPGSLRPLRGPDLHCVIPSGAMETAEKSTANLLIVWTSNLSSGIFGYPDRACARQFC
jgi:hypothetical protein